jgi:hypothetical protein
VILFKPEHVPMILSRRKTQTRRVGKKRWNVGAVHQCQTRMLKNDSVFCHVRILDVRRERLREMRPGDIYAEGYDRYSEYMDALERINGVKFTGDDEVWVVEFKVEAPEASS